MTEDEDRRNIWRALWANPLRHPSRLSEPMVRRHLDEILEDEYLAELYEQHWSTR